MACKRFFRRLFVECLEDRKLLSVTPGLNHSTGTDLTSYRLALATTAEFTALNGGVAATHAALEQVIADLNKVYADELAIEFKLVPNNDLLLFTNPVTDGYTDGNAFAMANENTAIVDAVIGSGNYDLGHVIGSRPFEGADGVGFLNAVGSVYKGGGASIASNISFVLGILLHEMGHQSGAEHSFNGVTDGCFFGRVPSNSYEPGSGSTIIAYQGICGSDDLTTRPGDGTYFHSVSFDQILSYLESIPSVGTRTSTGNTIPAVGAGFNRTIPASTPFTLTGSSTDPDAGDVLTYAWEQIDLGDADGQTVPIPAAADNVGPLFRSYAPSVDPSRTFPRLEDILANTPALTNQDEHLPTQSRELNFRLTARDHHQVTIGGEIRTVSGVNSDDVKLTVVNTGAPFQVTTPNTAVAWVGNTTQTVTWNVAGTNANGINTTSVKIRLSTDGGRTFPFLLATTANDGTHAIQVPNISSTASRIKVEAVGNVFFDISDANFAIASNLSAPGVTITETGSSTRIEEGGPVDSFQLRLNTNPAGNVTVKLTANADSLLSLNGIDFATTRSMTLNSTAPRTIFVKAVNDAQAEGPRQSAIQTSVTVSTSPQYPVGMIVNQVVATVVDDEMPPLVGVDFDFDCCGSLTPDHWARLTFLDEDAFDLVQEDGTPTNIDMITDTFGFHFVRTGHPLARTVPKHEPSLFGIGGSSSAEQNVTVTWNSLVPGQEYAVYVFGLDVDPTKSFTQTVTITGAGGALPSFTQTLKEGELFVNDQLGSANRSLLSYAKTVLADTSGQIKVQLVPGAGSDGVSLGGLAIGKLPVSTPRLFFDATLGTGEVELYRSNGDAVGTRLVTNLAGAANSHPRNLTTVGSTLYFTATLSSGEVELYKSDGTATGTAVVRNLSGTISANPRNLTPVGDMLFFAATLPSGEVELHKSDGTSTGTVLVRDLLGTSSANPSNLTAVGNTLFFTASLATGEVELYKSDGSSSGTVLVTNLSGTTSANPSNLTAVGNTLFFTATQPDGQVELYKSNGSPSGTQLVRDLSGIVSSNPSHLTALGNTLFFAATLPTGEVELHKSDGSVAGTDLVRNLSGAVSSNPDNLTAVGSLLFFTATLPTGEVELHKSNGAFAGTVLVKNLSGATNSNPRNLTAFGDTVLFTAAMADGQVELFKTNGSAAGTVQVINLSGATSSNPSNLKVVGSRVFFAATLSTGQVELFKSDGTTAGTALLINLSGATSSNPINLISVPVTVVASASASAFTAGAVFDSSAGAPMIASSLPVTKTTLPKTSSPTVSATSVQPPRKAESLVQLTWESVLRMLQSLSTNLRTAMDELVGNTGARKQNL